MIQHHRRTDRNRWSACFWASSTAALKAGHYCMTIFVWRPTEGVSERISFSLDYGIDWAWKDWKREWIDSPYGTTLAQPITAIDSATEGPRRMIKGHRIWLDRDTRGGKVVKGVGGFEWGWKANWFGLGYQTTEQVVAVQWPCVALHRHHLKEQENMLPMLFFPCAHFCSQESIIEYVFKFKE